MKKTLQIVLSLILAISVILSCVGVGAADNLSGMAGATVSWSVDRGTGILSISGTGLMSDFDGSGGPWKVHSNDIETIIISEGITNIGNNAFSGCIMLKTATIPSSVTAIGSGAFMGCQNIESVTIPKSVTSINSNAFGQTTPVIHCAEGSIAAMFASDKGLETKPLKTGEIHTGSCGATIVWTYDETTGLLTISGDGDMNSFSDSNAVPWANYKAGIKLVKIEGNVNNIGNNAFAYCQKLQSVTMPGTITEIGAKAFCNCISLQKISISASVNDIGDNAFDNCTALESVSVAEGNKKYISEDGVLYNKDKSVIVLYPAASKTEEYKLADSVTVIGEKAFAYGINLKKLTLGKNLKTIGEEAFFKSAIKEISGECNIDTIEEEAFRECAELERFSVSGVKLIKENAFGYCKKLTEFNVKSIEEIKERAFYICLSLEKIKLPESLKTFDGSAFNSCESLKEVIVDSNNKYFTMEGNVIFSKDKTELVYMPEALNVKEYTVPDSVKKIGKSAFYNTKLKEVKLCDGLEIIDNHAFYNGSQLINVIIPDSVTSIGEYAYSYSSKIKKLTIGSSVTEIKKAAFSNCSSIEGVVIPDSVVSVGDYAFEHCTSLKSLKLGEKLETIGIYSFYKCSSLKMGKIPSKIEVGAFAFRGCYEDDK